MASIWRRESLMHISTVISTERSEWRNLDKMLILNRFLGYALRATLEMTNSQALSLHITSLAGTRAFVIFTRKQLPLIIKWLDCKKGAGAPN